MAYPQKVIREATWFLLEIRSLIASITPSTEICLPHHQKITRNTLARFLAHFFFWLYVFSYFDHTTHPHPPPHPHPPHPHLPTTYTHQPHPTCLPHPLQKLKMGQYSGAGFTMAATGQLLLKGTKYETCLWGNISPITCYFPFLLLHTPLFKPS